MLAQHIITKPVFDALFEGYAFTSKNPVSQSMQKIMDILEAQALDKEHETLEGFYASVRERASGITDPKGRQKIIVELYDKFFKTAFGATSPLVRRERVCGSPRPATESEIGMKASQANALVRAGAVDAADRAYGVTRLTRPFDAAPHGAFVH